MATKIVCSVCDRGISSKSASLECTSCYGWVHKGCSHLSTPEFNKILATFKRTGSYVWDCPACSSGEAIEISTGGKSEVSSNDALILEPSNVSIGVLSKKLFDLQSKQNVTNKDLVSVMLPILQLLIDREKHFTETLSQLKVSYERIDQLEIELAEIKTKVGSMESMTNDKHQTSLDNPTDAGNSESLLYEIQSRSLREKNVIMHNIPENTSRDLKTRIEHDSQAVREVVNSIGVFVDDFKCIRLGRQSVENDRPRPLKVILPNKEVVIKLFSSKRRLAGLGSSVRIAADMTALQRGRIKRLHEELAKRRKDGETDITIRYAQGVPKIVKSKPLSKNDKNLTYITKT